jgi:phospholipid/cholesterol/gamma-HCH transport system substrate-binding protein
MPEKKHDFTLTEIKAGAMLLVSLAVLALFIAVISGMRPREKTLTFAAYFKDTSGLNKGADVRFGGAKVGRVAAIRLDPTDQSRIRIEASVQDGTPVNAKSEAFITQTTLTAEKHLQISTGERAASLLEDGSEIPTREGGLFDVMDEVARSIHGILDDVKDLMGVQEAKEKKARGEGEVTTIATLFDDVDKTVKKGTSLVDDIRDVVKDSRDDVSSILSKADGVGDSAKRLVDDLDATLTENRGDIRGVMEGAHGVIDDAQPIVQRVAQASERLDGIASSLQATLDNAHALSGEAQGMLSKNRPAIEDIILDLRETVRHLKTFSRTMAEQPQAVIRGKAPQGRK